MRTANVERSTKETAIKLSLNLDGQGRYRLQTPVPFLDHLLTQMALHGLIDLELEATGDIHIDDHHTVEDVGIVLGQAFRQALGEGTGVVRFGFAAVPLDEALALVAVDLSGRPFLAWEAAFPTERVGSFETSLLEEFLRAFVAHAAITLHVRLLAGRNGHHMAEAIFKALGRALAQAVAIDPRRQGIPSTKGQL